VATPIKVVFLDLTGTLIERDRWLDGAIQTIKWLNSKSFEIRYVTNITLKNRTQLKNQFQAMGVAASEEQFFTPSRAAYNWFRNRGVEENLLPLVHPDLLHDLEGLRLTGEPVADFVLVGDMGDWWQIDKLNVALRALLGGARLTALQKGGSWLAPDGYRMDAGSFVAALEYAANVKCDLVFGKPNPVFFEMALRDAGISPDNALMVGDDLENDYLAPSRLGVRTVLVRTSSQDPSEKSGAGMVSHPEVDPRNMIGGIEGLPEWISKTAR